MSVPASSSIPAPPGRGGSAGGRLRWPVLSARGGDHAAVYCFLKAIFQGPSAGEFRSSLEDPFYEPHDRLLSRRDNRLVAHVHLTHREMQFGLERLPVAGLGWLATTPEYRRMGLGRQLLAAAERDMALSGALVGWLRTSIPHFFRGSDWAVCGRHSCSRAGARAVLSGLLDRGTRRCRRRLQIRPWKRWEEAALKRIYDQNLSGAYGALVRSDAYWRWLLRRRAYDQVYVALDGPNQLDLEETNTRIVGYAVTRGERIVELMAAPDCRHVSAELLGRCCRDIIEHGLHHVQLHAPPECPLHAVFEKVGGRHHYHETDRGPVRPANVHTAPAHATQVHMARLLQPLKLLRRLGPVILRRAEAADLPRPLELGLAVEGKKYHLAVTPQDVAVEPGTLGRSYLQLNVADFTRLLLGQLNWDLALSEGRLEASTALARRTGRALFPRVPLWRPPLDDLEAPHR